MGSIFRKGSEQTGQSQGLSNDQAWMAKDLWQKTAPLRDHAGWQLADFMQTGDIPGKLKSTVGLGVPMAQQEAELANAKRGIMDSMPRGGLQQRALMELPLQRMLQRDMLAGNRAQIDDQTRQNLFSTALQTGFGTGGSSIGQLGAAADHLSQLGSQRMAQNYQAQQGIGKLAGAAASAGMGMKGMPGFGAPGAAVSQAMPGIGSFNVGSSPFLVNMPR